MAEQSTELKLWVVLSRAYGAIAAQVKADVARHGLTPASFGVMEALYHKGPMVLTEVKDKILISSGGITYLVDQLEEKGLVERRKCGEDRRVSYAALTDRGEALMRKIFPPHAEMLEDLISILSVDEQREVTAHLRKLGRAVASAV